MFKEIKSVTVSFKPNENNPVGEISLRHFCIPMLGKRRHDTLDPAVNAEQTKGMFYYCTVTEL